LNGEAGRWRMVGAEGDGVRLRKADAEVRRCGRRAARVAGTESGLNTEAGRKRMMGWR